MAAAAIPPLDSLLATLTHNSLHVRPSALHGLLTTLLSSPHPPTEATLLATLRSRVLATDITTTLQPYANLCFPAAISAGGTFVLPRDGVVVQVRDVIDLTVSRIEALEALEMGGRGEVARGREVIRVVPDEDGGQGTPQLGGAQGGVRKGAMHKVLLEDASGRRAWGVEEGRVEGVREGMNIGAKMVLKGCGVARGVVMLGPATASVMGGRIEEAHKAWMEGRMDRVRREIEGMKE